MHSEGSTDRPVDMKLSTSNLSVVHECMVDCVLWLRDGVPDWLREFLIGADAQELVDFACCTPGLRWPVQDVAQPRWVREDPLNKIPCES